MKTLKVFIWFSCLLRDFVFIRNTQQVIYNRNIKVYSHTCKESILFSLKIFKVFVTCPPNKQVRPDTLSFKVCWSHVLSGKQALSVTFCCFLLFSLFYRVHQSLLHEEHTNSLMLPPLYPKHGIVFFGC